MNLAGTKEERGLIAWGKEMELDAASDESPLNIGKLSKSSTYDFPYGMDALRRYNQINIDSTVCNIFNFEILFFFYSCKWSYYIPFLPTYRTAAKKQ